MSADDLVIVTKVGARRGKDGSVLAASASGTVLAWELANETQHA